MVEVALFGFDLPDESAAQSIDVLDFAFVLALRRLDGGRFAFVNAGTLDENGRLNLTLAIDPGEDFSDLRLIVADAGFFDRRKLDLPPMPIFDSSLFGVGFDCSNIRYPLLYRICLFYLCFFIFIGIDLKVASKFFGQKFACGASITGDDEIVIQGDFKDDLFDLIPEKWPEVRGVHKFCS